MLECGFAESPKAVSVFFSLLFAEYESKSHKSFLDCIVAKLYNFVEGCRW